MKEKRWMLAVLGITMFILFGIGGITVIVDPFFHYHKPLKFLQYPMADERYQNDGISRNYAYDAIITGSSMSQNFKTSEFDELWGSESIKIAYSGGTYCEVNDAIQRALQYNSNVKYVIRSLDGNRLNYSADAYGYENCPEYLYDDNYFNDVEYLWNKDVIIRTIAVLNYTRAGNRTPTMDEYGSFSAWQVVGREAVEQTLSELPKMETEYVLTQEDWLNITSNIQKNVLQIALDNPQVTFYCFFPPYSIYYYKTLAETKQLAAQMEAEKEATRILLEADNIRIFCFADNVELCSNLDNYSDSLHYGAWVNSKILSWMYQGEYELTEENFQGYFDDIMELYEKYDYSHIQ